MKVKKTTARLRAKKASSSLGARIIKGLDEALAWSKGEDVAVRVTQVQIPDVSVSEVGRSKTSRASG